MLVSCPLGLPACGMSDVEELTVHWEEDDQVMVQERGKRILQDGSWATVLFCYDERDRKTGDMHGPKFALRRYRSHGGKHHVHSKFVITSEEQARLTAETLMEWLKDPPEAAPLPPSAVAKEEVQEMSSAEELQPNLESVGKDGE